MDVLKKTITERLEHLPDSLLQEVIDFVDFLVWKKITRSELLSSNEELYSPNSELDEESSIHYVGGVLVVKAGVMNVTSRNNLDTAVQDLRQERLRKLTSW